MQRNSLLLIGFFVVVNTNLIYSLLTPVISSQVSTQNQLKLILYIILNNCNQILNTILNLSNRENVKPKSNHLNYKRNISEGEEDLVKRENNFLSFMASQQRSK